METGEVLTIVLGIGTVLGILVAIEQSSEIRRERKRRIEERERILSTWIAYNEARARWQEHQGIETLTGEATALLSLGTAIGAGFPSFRSGKPGRSVPIPQGPQESGPVRSKERSDPEGRH